MLMSPQRVAEKTRSAQRLYLAGSEALLSKLPKGDWIGGTIPYFMDETGGCVSTDQIFVAEQNPSISGVEIRSYGEDTLPGIVSESPANGFSVVIIPAGSAAHARYAQEAPDYEGLFMKQIIGWIAGVSLDEIGAVSPKVFNGQTGEVMSDKAVVMHATLPSNKLAAVGIVNLFEQGNGDVLTFSDEGFAATNCLINGQPGSLANYITDKGIDTRLPLVADYHGEMINVSVQSVDLAEGVVKFYAPVFKGVEYRFASPVADYVNAFAQQIPPGLQKPEFSCNCILNYLYSELNGKKTGDLVGPITFGEIAYQLLNQTLVFLQIHDV